MKPLNIMKFRNIILALLLGSLAIFTGCGVSESVHQSVKNELQQIKKKSADASAELDGVKQKIASLTTSLAEQKKTIESLNDSIKAAGASNAKLESRIDELMNPEASAFSAAQVTDNTGNKESAMMAYAAFARDFPFSSKNALARDKVESLNKSIANDKWVADAPNREARAAAKEAAKASETAAKNEAEQQEAYDSGYNFGAKYARLYAHKIATEGDLEHEIKHFQNYYWNVVYKGRTEFYKLQALSGWKAGFEAQYKKDHSRAF